MEPSLSSERLISVEHICFSYGEQFTSIFEDFSWRILRGESWAILGQSGSGKTTLLYLLAGLLVPDRGRVCLGDRPIIGPSTSIALMLQNHDLLPWLTAEQNIHLGLRIRGLPRSVRQQRVRDWLQRLQIDHVAKHYPSQLSGGQRQRVALARALTLETEVLLLDEPFSSIDELTREHLQEDLWQLRQNLNLTLILVTHSVEEAAFLGEQVLVLRGLPPTKETKVLCNPQNGSRPLRSDVLFQSFCTSIRAEIKESC